MKAVKIAIFLVLASSAFAHCDEFTSLKENSPFGVGMPDTDEDAQSSELESYELRGVFAGPNGKLFSIYTVSDQSSRWVRQGDASSGISVESYDESTKTLNFTASDGVKRSIRLKNTTDGI
ncbi:MAG: hypothetical protein LBI61_01490 [Puniceicoccales bacterium]|jgi:hypothetical protein|nr:hypothetical protein [Puniceicoccales bacterium]